jgi:hypothetical protein
MTSFLVTRTKRLVFITGLEMLWAAGIAWRLATALFALTSRWSVPLLSLLLLLLLLSRLKTGMRRASLYAAHLSLNSR